MAEMLTTVLLHISFVKTMQLIQVKFLKMQLAE